MPKIKVVVEVIASEPDRAGHVYSSARFYDTETGASIEVGDMKESNARAACLKMGHTFGEFLIIESTIPRRQFTRALLDKWLYCQLEDVGQRLKVKIRLAQLSH